MKKSVVVYKSKYGTTEKYAKELATRIDADIFKESDIKINELKNYKTIIYGGNVFANQIAGVSLITKNIAKLDSKNIIIFSVGLANPKTSDFGELVKQNFANIPLDKIKVFHLRGGLNFKTLKFMDRTLMNVIKKKLEKTPESERTEDNNTLVIACNEGADFVDFSTLAPIINYCNSLK